jgi:hypothetical protein
MTFYNFALGNQKDKKKQKKKRKPMLTIGLILPDESW